MRKYPKYKDSGVGWLITIPFDWELKKLKFKANIQFSNVDKLSDDSEIPVLLCNYVDVYKNEKIYNELQFMQATANNSEIKKFKLKKGDVLITKDSESVDDIAVPALVIDDFENVLCGYHLAQIKVQKDITGEFLFRLFQSKDFNQNFESSANGMTRYGLSVMTIKNVIIPIPPLPEQLSIVQFLDHKTNQIYRFIANRQKQIELLKEQKAGIINKAVTKGIGSLSVSTERSRSGVETPNVKMKDSGIEWIGEVPEHWEIVKLKFLTKKISKGTTPSTEGREILETGGIRFLKAENITPDGISLFPEFFIDDETNQILKRSQLQEHDILFVIAGATIGKAAIITDVFIPANTNQAVCFIRLKKNVLPELVLNQLQACYIKNKMAVESVVAAQPNISMENIGNFQIFLPPIDEQSHLMKFIKEEVTNIDTLISKYQKQIDLMQEYRTALISQAVTGKIDVREWKPQTKKYKMEPVHVGMAAEKPETYN